MNVFIQGMRRSGTTILYDAFLEDPALTCFYEPFREDRATPGGGSGAHEMDLFARTRELRREFRRERHPEVELESFNYGGPGNPALELDRELPAWGRELVAELLDQGDEVVIKNVRMYRKVPVLAELDPGAALVHLVRDPRAVTASMMLGRRKQVDRYPDAEAFFGAHSRRKLWSSRAIAQVLLTQPEYAGFDGSLPDFMRVMLVWKIAFEATRGDGMRLFGDRYLMIRLEDLRTDPVAELGRVYALLGRPAPQGTAAWAERHVRPEQPLLHGEDPRWAEAARLLGMEAALRAGGYDAVLGLASPDGPRLELEPAPGPRSRLSSMLGRARRGLEREESGRRATD